MPGMNRSLQTDNSTVVSAFHTALFHQLLFVLFVLLVLAVAFNVVRTLQYRRAAGAAGSGAPGLSTAAGAAGSGAPGLSTAAGAAGSGAPGLSTAAAAAVVSEPPARRLLRIGFGLLWLLDGLLQLQPSMPLGLPSGVVQPSAAGAPDWVHHLVNRGLDVWIDHPVQAAAAAVWIQVGLGLWLLVAPRGRWSRAGGLATAAWGLLVWVFGEAFGGALSGGPTVLFGFPGAALFYAAAGVLLAWPEASWRSAAFGRRLVRVLGAFFVGAAVLQAWPGRGFWQGRTAHGPGTLTAMVTSMAQTPQPHLLSSWVHAFATVTASAGGVVNLAIVLLLGGIGAALLSARRRWVAIGGIGAAVTCLAVWVLVQDFGFFGGLGTDPNSMLPLAVLVGSGTLAVLRVPATATEAVPADSAPEAVPATAAPGTGGAGTGRATDPPTAGGGASPGGWEAWTPSYLLRTVAAVAALAVVLVGAAPMALASANHNVDPIIDEAFNGTPGVLDSPAPDFHLVDQNGRPVSMAGLRGHVVALTFLDPVCTSDCPLIAQNLRIADQRLQADADRIDYVAVVTNPVYRSLAVTRAFDRQEGLTRLPNWYYLTGSKAALEQVWYHYGIEADVLPAGAMVDHSELVFVIDAAGRERYVLGADPGNGGPDQGSFASLLSGELQQVLRS